MLLMMLQSLSMHAAPDPEALAWMLHCKVVCVLGL